MVLFVDFLIGVDWIVVYKSIFF